MREQIVTLDANGKALDVGTQGYGFRVVPARPPGNTGRPGSYPIRVFPNGSTAYFECTSDDSKLINERFNWLTLTGGEQGDSWKIQIFESPTEAVFPPGQRGSVAVPVQAQTAVPVAAPALATDGFKVRPGTKAHTFYFAGALSLARLYVRSAAGNWYDTGDDLDPTSNLVQYRLVYSTADRFALKAAAGGLTVEIDSEVEVG